MPRDVLWLRRIRVLRRMLKKYRKAGKIDAHLYHDLYLRVKGEWDTRTCVFTYLSCTDWSDVLVRKRVQEQEELDGAHSPRQERVEAREGVG